MPKHWFVDPLNQSLKMVVRPPTKLTRTPSRRKEVSIDMKLPTAIFLDLMNPMDNGDMVDFEWEDETKQALKHTTAVKNTKTFTEYKYTIAKPDKVGQVLAPAGSRASAAQARGGEVSSVSPGARKCAAAPLESGGGSRAEDRPSCSGDRQCHDPLQGVQGGEGHASAQHQAEGRRESWARLDPPERGASAWPPV